MDKRLIELFKAEVGTTNEVENAGEIILYAASKGYIITPEICTEDMIDFLDSLPNDYNSTFYKTWDDVISRDRNQIFLEQILHYASTYGSCFSLGNGFTCNDGCDEMFDFSDYKIIKKVTIKDVLEMCSDILYSGIALKNETCKLVCEFLLRNMDKNLFNDEFFSSIKNKEAKVILYKSLDIFPQDKFEIIRYMVYLATGEPLVIKSKDTLIRIAYHCRYNPEKIDFNKLSQEQLKGLASIFYRYKDIILMFKNDKNNAKVINRIRRMAKYYHKPLTKGYWESLFETVPNYNEVYEKSAEITNFKIVTLMQGIMERAFIFSEKNSSEDETNPNSLYLIRNGKFFLKENNSLDKTKVMAFLNMYSALRRRLIENLSKKACTIKYPEWLSIACPSSEKNFVGNYPFGTNMRLTDDNIIGIYWRNEWGTHDFDISMIDTKGNKIGWNSNYYDDDNAWIYSGDMTSASPEATELLYCKKSGNDGLVYCNRYNGAVHSNFRFFLANHPFEDKKVETNYMVNPDDIKVQEMMESVQREQMLGVKADDKFYFMSVNAGDRHVSCNNTEHSLALYNAFKRKAKTTISLKAILTEAGFTECKEDEKPELDLTDINKETLIELFS